MPAYSRDSGEWTNTVARQRSDAAWTGDDALGFVRDGGAWVQFQAPVGDTVLFQPEDLVATPGDIDASFTWSNPTPAASATPTHIQFRLPSTTSVWTELEYPATETSVGYLTTATDYQFQCRYIERVDGSISRTGPITEVFFTTLAIDGPGEPVADPGGTGGDSSTDWPLPTGGGGGGPWTVGGAGCWWEYTIQTWDYATLFSDSVLIANVEVDGDIGALTYNWVSEGFSCDDVLRWKYREVCDSVPGDWQYGYPWTVVCDYADPCGGGSQTVKFATAPFNDVDCVFAMPKMCWNATTFKNEIIDYAAADVTYGKLSGFAVPLYVDASWQLVADSGLSAYGEPICAGHVPGLVPLGSSVPSLTSDFSVAGSFYLDTIPSAGSGAPVKILEIGKTVKLYAYASGSSWTVSAGFPMEGGGRFTLTGTTLLAADEFHHVAVTIDQDGDKILYVNGAVEVTDADTTRADFGGLNGDVELRGNDNAKIKDVGGWGRVLTPTEVASLIHPGFEFYSFALSDTTPTISVSTDDVMVAMSAEFDISTGGPGNPNVDPISGTWVQHGYELLNPAGVGEFRIGVWYKIVTAPYTGSWTASSLYMSTLGIFKNLDLSGGIDTAIQFQNPTLENSSSTEVVRQADSPYQSFAFLAGGSEPTPPAEPTPVSSGLEQLSYVHGKNNGDSYQHQQAGVSIPADGSAEVAWNGSVAQGSGGYIVNTRQAGDAAFTHFATVTDKVDAYSATGSTYSFNAPTLATGDLLVCAMMCRYVPVTVPAGFTLIHSAQAATEAGFTGQCYIYAGVEGTDFTYSGSSLTYDWGSAGRTIVTHQRIESSSGTMSKTGLVVGDQAFSEPSGTGTHAMSLAAVPSGSVVTTAHTCLYASNSGDIDTPDSLQTVPNTDTRGCCGTSLLPQSGTVPISVLDTTGAGHFGVTVAVAFGPA